MTHPTPPVIGLCSLPLFLLDWLDLGMTSEVPRKKISKWSRREEKIAWL